MLLTSIRAYTRNSQYDLVVDPRNEGRPLLVRQTMGGTSISGIPQERWLPVTESVFGAVKEGEAMRLTIQDGEETVTFQTSRVMWVEGASHIRGGVAVNLATTV